MIAATTPSHDPLPAFSIGDAIDRIDRAAPAGAMLPYVRSNARDFLKRHAGYDEWNIFLRSPFVESIGTKAIDMRWHYDGRELVLRFNAACREGAILDGRRVSEEEAVAAIIEWNQHVIRGEGRRLRERRESALLDGTVVVVAVEDEGDE